MKAFQRISAKTVALSVRELHPRSLQLRHAFLLAGRQLIPLGELHGKRRDGVRRGVANDFLGLT